MTRHCAVLILTLNSVLVSCGAAVGANAWTWRAGRVDPAREHLELRFGPGDEEWAAWIPVARVGPPVDGVFPVEFLLPLNGSRHADVIAAVRRELDYYLVELGEPDPWAYAIYHTGRLANLYSPVHWLWVTHDQPDRPKTDPAAP